MSDKGDNTDDLLDDDIDDLLDGEMSLDEGSDLGLEADIDAILSKRSPESAKGGGAAAAARTPEPAPAAETKALDAKAAEANVEPAPAAAPKVAATATLEPESAPAAAVAAAADQGFADEAKKAAEKPRRRAPPPLVVSKSPDVASSAGRGFAGGDSQDGDEPRNTAASPGTDGVADSQESKMRSDSLIVKDQTPRVVAQTVQLYTKLRSLMLPRNQLTEVPWLPSSLESLNLSHNSITRIDGLSGLTNLLNLDMSFNRVRSIDGLMEQHLLESLDLSNNVIETLSNLGHLQALHSLRLNNNRIRSLDVQLLNLNPRLENLWLSGNPIMQTSEDHTSILRMIPALKLLDGKRRLGPEPEISEDDRAGTLSGRLAVRLQTSPRDEDLSESAPGYDDARAPRREMRSGRGQSSGSVSLSATTGGIPPGRFTGVGKMTRWASFTQQRTDGKPKTIFDRLTQTHTKSRRAKVAASLHRRKQVSQIGSRRTSVWSPAGGKRNIPDARRSKSARSPRVAARPRRSTSARSRRTTSAQAQYHPPRKDAKLSRHRHGASHKRMPRGARRKAPRREAPPTSSSYAARSPSSLARRRTSPRSMSASRLAATVASIANGSVTGGGFAPARRQPAQRTSGSAFSSDQANAWIDELDLSSRQGIKRIIKNLNEKINKLYNWHLVEIDLVSKQQMQLNNMKMELDTARRRLAQSQGTAARPDANGVTATTQRQSAPTASEAPPSESYYDSKVSTVVETPAASRAEPLGVVSPPAGASGVPMGVASSPRSSQPQRQISTPRQPLSQAASPRAPKSPLPGLENASMPVRAWIKSLGDELKTSRMSLGHLVMLSGYKGGDFQKKLGAMKQVFKHCDVMKDFVVTAPVRDFIAGGDNAALRKHISRAMQRVRAAKKTIQTFLSLLEEVGPGSSFVAQIRKKIQTSGLLAQTVSPVEAMAVAT